MPPLALWIQGGGAHRSRADALVQVVHAYALYCAAILGTVLITCCAAREKAAEPLEHRPHYIPAPVLAPLHRPALHSAHSAALPPPTTGR